MNMIVRDSGMLVRGRFAAIANEYHHQQADVERRIGSMMRTGLITDVDEQKGLVRVGLGEDPVTGEIFKSPWIPVLESVASESGP